MQQAHIELSGAVANPTFTWKGFDYICTYALTEGQWLDEGGIVPQDALVIQVLASTLPDPGPQKWDRVTFFCRGMLAPKDFWIHGIKRTPGLYVIFQCYDTNRGT